MPLLRDPMGCLNFSAFLTAHGLPLYRTAEDKFESQDRRNDALHLFALKVLDGLFDLITKIPELSAHSRSPDGTKFLLYGCGRRLSAIRRAFDNLVGIAYPGRTQPLSGDLSHEADLYLNAIYINIRGVADNLAWALAHEKLPEGGFPTSVQSTHLYADWVKSVASTNTIAVLEQHRDWHKSLKERRDPSAHRIPLTIPPAIINRDRVNEYNKLKSDWFRAALNTHSTEADALHERLENFGTFQPVFLHDYDEVAYAIHPTIGNDIGPLLHISEAILLELYSPAELGNS